MPRTGSEISTNGDEEGRGGLVGGFELGDLGSWEVWGVSGIGKFGELVVFHCNVAF